MNNMCCKTFEEVDLKDIFFDSLKADYPDFVKWFIKKSKETAYVQYDEFEKLMGFLYLKLEYGKVDDIVPSIMADKILKVGTFKINAHGTKLGEQFIKVILEKAVEQKVDVCYVTIFPKHETLVKLVNYFGFEYYGTKGTGDRKENVYLRKMNCVTGDINKDYPYVKVDNARKHLLGIYPQYHSILFPDSILNTENKDIITDVSYTNSIHKVYVCSMFNIEKLRYGDILVLYRTAEPGKSAEYSAVATSLGVVEEVKLQSEFKSFEHFYRYACQYSVFNKADLRKWYDKGGCKAIKMTYNAALKKRIVRHELIESIGIERNQSYWGFVELTNEQFIEIATRGGVTDVVK